jgi:hypothetical protein
MEVKMMENNTDMQKMMKDRPADLVEHLSNEELDLIDKGYFSSITDLSDDVILSLKKITEASKALTIYIEDNDLFNKLIEYIKDESLLEILKMHTKDHLPRLLKKEEKCYETRHWDILKKIIFNNGLKLQDPDALKNLIFELKKCEINISKTIDKEKDDYNKKLQDIDDKRKKPLRTPKVDASKNDYTKR